MIFCSFQLLEICGFLLVFFFFFNIENGKGRLLHGDRKYNQRCYLQNTELCWGNLKGEAITKQDVVKLQEGTVSKWLTALIQKSLKESGYGIF